MSYRVSFRWKDGRDWKRGDPTNFTKSEAKKYKKYIESTHPVKGRAYKVKGIRRKKKGY